MCTFSFHELRGVLAGMRVPFLAACLLLFGLFDGTARAQTGSRLTLAQAQQAVNEHNRVRWEAGVTVMVAWDNGIAQYAQAWADHLAATGVAQHRPANAYGENIFWGSSNYGVVDAVRSWESEKSFYHGEVIDGSNYQIFGHYTQIIWDRTTKIGCGMATSPAGTVYIVANYSPAGNMLGQRPITAGSAGNGTGNPSGGSGQSAGSAGAGAGNPLGGAGQSLGGSGVMTGPGGRRPPIGGNRSSSTRTTPWDTFQHRSQEGFAWGLEHGANPMSHRDADRFRDTRQDTFRNGRPKGR